MPKFRTDEGGVGGGRKLTMLLSPFGRPRFYSDVAKRKNVCMVGRVVNTGHK